MPATKPMISRNQSLDPGGLGEFAIVIAAATVITVLVRKWLTR
jgi:hypothetical protein